VASTARVTIIGNLGRDPETRYTPNGRMNVGFSVAVNRRHTDAGGNVTASTAWYRVTAWGRLAETLDRLTQQGALIKGRHVFVSGRLDAREYQDQQGQLRTSLDVDADDVQLLGERYSTGEEPTYAGAGGHALAGA
jgi:single-strand DNA-binding protein